jgi:hypothetical protein
MLSDRMSSSDTFTFYRHYPFSHYYRGRPFIAEKENNPYLCDRWQDSVTMHVYRLIMWQLYERQTYFGQNADNLLMKHVVHIVTTAFRVNVIYMIISLGSYSGQWRRLCRTTHLQDCRCRFQQFAQNYHLLSLETFHIFVTSLCINCVFLQRYKTCSLESAVK